MADKQKQPQSAKLPSTQRFLAIAEIRDGTVVLRDGTLRTALLCSSVNFSLKSDEEQEALIAGYVQFLNTLDFPLQIVVQSRKLSIDTYLSRLAESEKNQTNELLRLQIADYRKFVSELVELGAIMSKRFFMVVPYNPLSDKKRGFFSRLQDVITPARAVPPTVSPSPGYDRRLQESRGDSGTTIYTPAQRPPKPKPKPRKPPPQ